MTLSRQTLTGLLLAIALGCLSQPGCNSGGGTSGTGSGGGGAGGSGDAPRFISVGTAPVGGAFYNVGAAISEVLNDGKSTGGWRQATAESTGGTLENLRRLDGSEIELGMANSSITYFAVRGERGFEKQYDVKSVMTLFPLIAMFVTKQGSGVETIADLKGKRVVIGPEGAGFEYFVGPILEEHGVTYDDFEAVSAGMQTSVGYLQDESVAASFLGGGMRSPAITSAATSMDVHLVPYTPKARDALSAKYKSFNKLTVPADTYKGQTEPFEGLNVGSAHLLVRSDTSDDFAYNVAKIIYEGREKIAESHAAGRSINAENVVRHTGTDFHPGAIRYYQEIGIWPEEESTEEASATDDAAEPPPVDAAPAEEPAE